MAQTIATQRGTGSLYNGIATLFTQSGGNATRVIFNQLAFYSNSSTMSSAIISIIHTVSNGSTNIIGWWRPNGGVYAGQICPNPNGTSPMQTTWNTNGYGNSNGGLIQVNTLNYPGSFTVFAITGYSDMGYGSYAPQNFWIGPGDSVAIRFYDGNGNGLNYAYHFVTITES